MPNPLQEIVNLWLAKFKEAKKRKKAIFSDVADECWRYYGDTDHKFMLDKMEEQYRPEVLVTRNLTFEYVSLLLPFLHNRAPVRLVKSRRPPIPQEIMQTVYSPYGQNPEMAQQVFMASGQRQQADQLRAWLMQWVLNYTPELHDLRGHGRMAVIEALVKGRGILWHEMERGMPGSFFVSVDDLFIDHECESLRNASYIYRRRRRPAWEIAEDYGLPVSVIRAAAKSRYDKGTGEVSDRDMTYPDLEDDSVEYLEAYSRCGAGGAFSSSPDGVKDMTALLDRAGNNCFFAILEGLPYPLNLPPHVMEVGDEEEILRRMRWHTDFWANPVSPWPFTELDFYAHPRRPWSMSPLAPALPLQRFINFAYSFLLSRSHTTTKQLIVASKALQESFIQAIKSGRDLAVIDTDDMPADVSKLYDVVAFPPLNQDLFRVIEMVSNAFERATGLTELAYGQGGQKAMRSSAEAQIRQQNMSIRPDDMAECVEDWHSRIAAHEALMMRTYVPPPKELFGEEQYDKVPGPLSLAWGQYVNEQDPMKAAAELSYHVAAGTGRKRNLQKEQADIEAAMQVVMPHASQMYMQMGDPMLHNGLMEWFAESHEMRDPSIVQKLMLPDMRQQMQMMQQQEQPVQ